jgi:hypothetical protein
MLQTPPIAIFNHKVYVVGGDSEIVQVDQVFMLEFLKHLHFLIFKNLFDAFVIELLGIRTHLDCNL